MQLRELPLVRKLPDEMPSKEELIELATSRNFLIKLVLNGGRVGLLIDSSWRIIARSIALYFGIAKILGGSSPEETAMITAALIASCNGLPGNIITATLILTKRDKWAAQKTTNFVDRAKDFRISKKTIKIAQQALAKIKKQPYSESHAKDTSEDKQPVPFATETHSKGGDSLQSPTGDGHDLSGRGAAHAFSPEW